MGVYAVIPVKGNSERVISKNFRPFADGISLTELKVQQTVASGVFADVFISSDSEEAAVIAKKYGVSFIRRDTAYCNNQIPWSDVIHHVVESLPVANDDSICWSHSTSPLFWKFREAVNTYEGNFAQGFNGLVGVTRLNEYILTERARPVNYAWGVWHPYTQDVEKLYRVSGAVYIAPRFEMLRCRYVVPQSPYLYVTSPFEAVDVDTEYDFKLAQLLYRNRDDIVGTGVGMPV